MQTENITINNTPKPITFQTNIYGKVLNLLPKEKDLKILDVGAGQGYFAKILNEQGYKTYATDFLKDNFIPKDIAFVTSDLNKHLPFEDNFFDISLSVEVIEHIENHFKFVEEIVRVTKPGGKIIITTPNVLNLSARLGYLLYGFSDCAPYPIDPKMPNYFMEHINPISLPEMMFLFAKNNCKVVDVRTNRYRKGSIFLFPFFYPLLKFIFNKKFLNKKYKKQKELHLEHKKWMLTPANLLGRISIVEFQRLS